jgi:NADH-quinone oxidoreductase subunit H
MLWFFLFLVIYVPWIGIAVLGPIAESAFLQWALNVVCILRGFVSLVFFLTRVMSSSLRMFSSFCSRQFSVTLLADTAELQKASLFVVLLVAPLGDLIVSIASLIFLLVGVLLSVAFLTLAERKLMGSTQRRVGPNLVGFWGLLQPVADGLKLILKDNDIPSKASKILFFIAALLPFVISFSTWVILPLSSSPISDFSSGPLWVAAMSSVGVYGIIFSGWASNSKYALLGGLRSAAQVISYELVLSLVYLTVTVWNQTLNFYTIIETQHSACWNIFALFPCAVAFLVAMLAETNRTPFDLPEAESELVAGYNVEYRGVLFSLFFLAEYSNMILMSALFSILFLGGWAPFSFSLFGFAVFTIPGSFFFIFKIELVLAFFILARAALPRVRYDQLMTLSWKFLIPFLFAFFFLVSSITFFFILS